MRKDIYLSNNKDNEGFESIKSFFLILMGILVFIGLIYLIFIFKEKINKKKEPVLQYEKILAKDILNQEEANYYVLIYDFKDGKLKDLVTSYKDKKSLKIYEVDKNMALNKDFVSDIPNLKVTNIKDFKVKENTLIEIKGKSIISAYTGDDISRILK